MPKPIHKHSWFPVAGSMVAVAWGGNEFTPLLVMYREQSHFSQVTVNGLLAAYVLGIIPALLISGPLSDHIGRRPTMLPAAPLSLLGSFLLSIGPNEPLVIAAGRVLCGLALGIVMAVGSTWVSELITKSGGDPASGPQRASLSLTIGFLIGAALASVLAQWGPWPTHTAYILHILLTVGSAIWLMETPETRPPRLGTVKETFLELRVRDMLEMLHIPSAAHRRFVRIVVPVAPWVFGCAGAAYALLPQLLSDSAHGVPIAFSGLMTVITLGCGVAIQMVGKLIDTSRSARASAVAMGVITVGTALGAVAAHTLSLPVGIASAAVMGAGYGLALVAGLSEVQRIAGEEELAGLTAVFYSVSYTGFFIPMAFSALAPYVGFTALFLAGTVLAVCCLVNVVLGWRAHLPGPRR
ncbi:permease of the major facilitator superfamily [Corynebacterium renale]|uniref:Putative MFS family arabinose efflux permease n=1 Tax=Corynebacterium renale TaxID=1724 RepID=A0A2A9DM70_9CORY|nr:MFS transporter [Corynebacterium renale]PFG27798.1 putative MFS family arabinose efflux permease [Corynebacterium renale]SQG63481.1 permease of the major facilitator superfamily [Corynebacterium renale]SQI22083.1 permease of the major facilitator superfamily [Corynebacterium renale]STD00322.1 permease of the major facilitator superfamily [Corynebacterium renale]